MVTESASIARADNGGGECANPGATGADEGPAALEVQDSPSTRLPLTPHDGAAVTGR